jgi:2-polyprenyl-6-methoxyphenol hydroxylase-like FAD-dependent oxidoreductase
MMFERMKFVQMLFETLQNKGKVKTGQRIIGIEQDNQGVRVRLEDGTIEHGDIVVGADGVHSWVREVMWEHINSRRSEKKLKTSQYSKLPLLQHQLIDTIRT